MTVWRRILLMAMVVVVGAVCIDLGAGATSAEKPATQSADGAISAVNPRMGFMSVEEIHAMRDPQNATAYAEAAERGDPVALNAYGNIARMFKGDNELAMKCFTQAAEQGNMAALYNLACMHSDPGGDAKKAVEMFEKGIRQRDSWCMVGLSRMYIFGIGVPEDAAKSADLLKRAAVLGNAYAQFELGGRYYDGWGVEADIVEAYAWAELARRAGFKDARLLLAALKKNITPEQRGRAEDRVAALAATTRPATRPQNGR